MYCPVKIRETGQRCHKVVIAHSGRRCRKHIGAQLGFSITYKQRATLRYLADLAKYKSQTWPDLNIELFKLQKNKYIFWSTKTNSYESKKLLQENTMKCLRAKGLVCYTAEGGWRTATLTQWGKDISKTIC